MSKEKLKPEYCFLKISLTTEKGGHPPDTATQLKGLIMQALQTLHGQVGASISVDVLSYHCREDRETCNTLISAFLRVPNRDQVKMWSALTLCAGQSNVCCVDKASSSLLSLAVNSRQFQFPETESWS